MKRKNRAQSSSLFLLELILAILFFSLSSAICLQLFVKSHLLSNDAQDLNLAVNECSGIAEIVNSSESVEDAMDTIWKIYPQMSVEETSPPAIYIYYDEKLSPCPEDEGSYVLTADFQEDGEMLKVGLAFKEIRSGSIGGQPDQSKNPIYQLTVEHYLKRRHANG